MSTRDKVGISAPCRAGCGCIELMYFVWILAHGARVLQVCRVPMCPGVGTGTCVRCCDGGDVSGGGGCGTVRTTIGGG
jgi:hypothetical protein